MAEGRYVSLDDLNLFARNETTWDGAVWLSALLAAEQTVDNLLFRRMEVADAEATDRTFAPDSWNSQTLWVDDFIDIDTLVVVESGRTLTLGTDFVLEPPNGRTLAGELSPYYAAKRHATWWSYNGYLPTVTITARWGWEQIPDLVVEGCKVIAKAILEGRDIKFGLVGVSEAGFGLSERDGKVVKDMVYSYRSHKAAKKMIA